MKALLTQIIVAGALCVVTVVGYGIWYAVIGAKSAEVANLESQIVTKTDTMSRVASARASLAEIAGDEASMQSYFVPESSVVSFIDNLEAQGHALGTTVNVLSVSKGGSGARPTLTFSLSVNGTFDAVMRTVGAIEYAPYDLVLSSLSVAHADKVVWQATLNLVVGSVSMTTATSTSKI